MINDDKQLCSRKSNDIIQNYSWHLTKRQLKLFEYLCCCVGTYHYNEEKNTITTSFQEMAKEFNDPELLSGGSHYKAIKELLDKLSDKKLFVDEKGTGGIFRILSEAIWKSNNSVVIYMSNSFREFTSNIANGYTFTELQIINSMSSKYTIQLYYLLQSWQGENELTFDIDYFRNKLQVPESSYKNVGKFKQILDKTVEEYLNVMNQYGKVNNQISYEIVKRGKKYVGVKLILHNAVSLEDISYHCKYKDKPNNIVFDSEDDKEQYIEDWISHNYQSTEIQKYEILYSCIPENVHNYDKNKVDAIYNVALEYANILCNDAYLPDIIFKCETIINRFNSRKWFTNYSKKVEKDIFAYYIKCFEMWCNTQKEK